MSQRDVRFKGIAVIALMSLLAGQAQLPQELLPSGLGINTHFTRGHERDLDMIAAAGFKVVRTDLTWSQTERIKNEYDWSAYDELTANLLKRGLRAYYILDYSNPIYEKTYVDSAGRSAVVSPENAGSVAAYARWAGAAARHFSGRGIIWEIWNEPNGGFWKPRPNAEQYTTLALAACRAIRAADPAAVVVAPAAAGFPWSFLETFLTSDMIGCLDGVSVHAYRREPETVVEDFARLRRLIDQYSPPGARPVAMVSGEWGYESNGPGMSPGKQASLIIRAQLANAIAGVPVSIVYDWKDPGGASSSGRDFGIVDNNLEPKPAYTSIGVLTRELSGFRFAGRLAVGGKNDFVLRFVNGGGENKLVMWTIGTPKDVDVDVGPTTLRTMTIRQGNGAQTLLPIQGARVTCPLNGDPQYLSLGGARLK